MTDHLEGGSRSPAADLIRQVGVFGLCGTDGCLCSHFSVHHVSVDVHCRKSDGGLPREYREGPYFHGTVVRVHSNSLDSCPEMLEPVAREVVSQLWPDVKHLPLIVRFCSWREDREQTCGYCSKARPPAEYLCEACAAAEDIAERYCFQRMELDPIDEGSSFLEGKSGR